MFKSAGCLHELCELFPVDWPSRNKSQSPLQTHTFVHEPGSSDPRIEVQETIELVVATNYQHEMSPAEKGLGPGPFFLSG